MLYDSIIPQKLYLANKKQQEEPSTPLSDEFLTLDKVLEGSPELLHRTRSEKIKADKKN